MFNRFKKKLTELKTDLNHKIDQLEVDKNHILYKTQRTIKPYLTSNGISYIEKKEQNLLEIQELARKNEQDSELFERQVKGVALVSTTNLFFTIRTLEKEITTILKTIESTRATIEKFNDFCLNLNSDICLLENVYEDLELERKIEQANKNEVKEVVLDDRDLETDDKIDLQEKSVKLTINFE